jgi:hypothetical protein
VYRFVPIEIFKTSLHIDDMLPRLSSSALRNSLSILRTGLRTFAEANAATTSVVAFVTCVDSNTLTKLLPIARQDEQFARFYEQTRHWSRFFAPVRLQSVPHGLLAGKQLSLHQQQAALHLVQATRQQHMSSDNEGNDRMLRATVSILKYFCWFYSLW